MPLQHTLGSTRSLADLELLSCSFKGKAWGRSWTLQSAPGKQWCHGDKLCEQHASSNQQSDAENADATRGKTQTGTCQFSFSPSKAGNRHAPGSNSVLKSRATRCNPLVTKEPLCQEGCMHPHV